MLQFGNLVTTPLSKTTSQTLSIENHFDKGTMLPTKGMTGALTVARTKSAAAAGSRCGRVAGTT
jgi:hypothetical protein